MTDVNLMMVSAFHIAYFFVTDPMELLDGINQASVFERAFFATENSVQPVAEPNVRKTAKTISLIRLTLACRRFAICGRSLRCFAVSLVDTARRVRHNLSEFAQLFTYRIIV